MKRFGTRLSRSEGLSRGRIGADMGTGAYVRRRDIVATTPQSRGTDSATVEDYAGRCIDWIVRLTAKHWRRQAIGAGLTRVKMDRAVG